MKKFMIVALMAIVSANASAQQFTHYVQGALTSMTTAGKDAREYKPSKGITPYETTNTIGFDVLYGFELPLVKGLYWGAEAGIGTSRGFECNFKESIVGTSYSVEYDEVFRTYAIRILPVNFGYRHKFNDRWAIDGHVGVGLSYDFAGGNKTTLNGNTKETKIADVDSYRPFDAYLKIGFGASYKHVGLDISYQRGLNKLLTETEMYASNLTIGVRYIF